MRRIEAALADEARLATGWAAPECPPELRADEEGHRSTVVALPGAVRTAGAAAGGGPGVDAGAGRVVPFRRRGSLRLLGAAAAAVVLLGAGGLVLGTTRPGGLPAALGFADTAGGGQAGSAAVERSEDASGLTAASTLVVGSDALRVQVVGGGLVLSSADLAAVATELPSSVPTVRSDAAPPGVAPAAGGLATATPAGGRACASALGIPRGDRVLLASATVDGEPAVLVLATSASGARTAWAVRPGCSATAPQVLAGPVPAG